MARGINKAIIVGNLGQDPETRYTANGAAITNISVATSESWNDKQTGEKQERTEWHRITFFGRLAEVAGEFLTKGSQVYIEGRIQTDKWEDKDGNDRYTTKIIASEMQMLGSKGDSGGSSSGGFRNSGQASSGAQSSAGNPAQQDGFADDDIPF